MREGRSLSCYSLAEAGVCADDGMARGATANRLRPPGMSSLPWNAQTWSFPPMGALDMTRRSAGVTHRSGVVRFPRLVR